jgi:hypothetical protein
LGVAAAVVLGATWYGGKIATLAGGDAPSLATAHAPGGATPTVAAGPAGDLARQRQAEAETVHAVGIGLGVGTGLGVGLGLGVGVGSGVADRLRRGPSREHGVLVVDAAGWRSAPLVYGYVSLPALLAYPGAVVLPRHRRIIRAVEGR